MIVTLCSAASSLAFVGVADAAGQCSGLQGNYLDGFQHDNDLYPGYDFEGASGYIVVQNGGLCFGGTPDDIGNFSNAWVMIAAGNANNSGWAQSGFELNGLGGLKWFSQWSPDGYHAETRYSYSQVLNQIGVRHTFRELYQQSCGCIQLYIDSTLWSYTHFNPFGTWSYPFAPVFKGEVGWPLNDMPGTATMKTGFSALGAQEFYGDNLVRMPCTMRGENNYPTRWAREVTAGVCDAFNIYTK